MGRQCSTLVYALLFCCLLSLLFVHLAEGKRNNNNRRRNRGGRAGNKGRDKPCKNKTTFTFKANDLKSSPVTLKCAKGPVVDTQLMGVKGHCKGTTGFTRWTEGRCLWNQTCHLEFQDRVFDSLAPEVEDKSCLGQVPDKLELSYTCLKKKVTITDTLGSFSKTKKKSGLIRSHKLFPWSYRNGQELGNVTFIKPRKLASPANLWFSVHLYAILPTDIIFLSWDDTPPPPGVRGRGRGGRRGGASPHVQALRQILPNDTLFHVSGALAVNLTFYADYRRLAPSSAQADEEKGFLLCYQWLKANAVPKKNSACSKVMMPAKCKNKPGVGKRRGKAGNSNSRKNQGARNNQRNNKRNNQRARNNRRPRNNRARGSRQP